MMELLKLKYPNLADKIDEAGSRGVSEKGVQSFLDQKIETARYRGVTDKTLHEYLGITNESRDKYLSELNKKNATTLTGITGMSMESIKAIRDLSDKTGLPPSLVKEHKNVAESILGTGANPPETVEDSMGLYKTPIPGSTRLSDVYTLGGELKFGVARAYSSLVEKPLWGLGATGVLAGKGLWKLAEAVGYHDGNVSRFLDEMLDYYTHPEETGIATPYSDAVRAEYRTGAYASSFMKGVANDLIDASTDLAGLVLQMSILGGAAKAVQGINTPQQARLAMDHSMTMMEGFRQQIGNTAKLHATHAFLTTPGDLREKVDAGIYRVAYNLTPYIANMTGAQGMTARMVDIALNTFITSPTYYKIFKEEGFSKEALASVIPQFVMDVGMAWGTTGWKGIDLATKRYAMDMEATTKVPAAERMKNVNALREVARVEYDPQKDVKSEGFELESEQKTILELREMRSNDADLGGQSKPYMAVDVLKTKDESSQPVKNKLEKAITFINGAAKGNITAEAREAIWKVQAENDLKLRSPKTLENIEIMTKFLDEEPDAAKDIHPQDLQMVTSEQINGKTAKEVIEVAEKIKAIRRQGELDYAKWRQEQEAPLQAKMDMARESVPHVEGKEVKNKTLDKDNKKHPWKKIKAVSLRPERILDTFDGFKNFTGNMVRIFKVEADNCENNYLKQYHSRWDAVNKARKEVGIGWWDTYKSRKVNGQKWSVQDLMGVYLAMKDPDARLALIHGNYSKDVSEKAIIDDINTLIGALTDKEKALADIIAKDFNDNFSRVDEFNQKMYQVKLKQAENYYPIRRIGVDYKTLDEEMLKTGIAREYYRQASLNKDFTKARQEIPAEHQGEIRLDIVSVWMDQMMKQERWMAYGTWARESKYISKELKPDIEKKFGKDYADQFDKYVQDAINPSIYKTQDAISKTSRYLRKHTAVACLAVNALTIAKQVPSLCLYLGESGPLHFMEGLADFIANPRQAIKFAEKNDAHMKYTTVEREMEEIKNNDPELYERILNSVGQTGMWGIKALDKVVKTIGWNAVYNQAKSEGLSHEEACVKARSATLRTQPAASAKDIAGMYRSSEGFNWFLMFSNQINQIWNIGIHDLHSQVANKDYQNAFYTTMGLVANGVAIWMLANKRIPENDDDIKDVVLSTMTNPIPMVGTIFNGALHGFKFSSVPPLQIAEGAADLANGKFNGNTARKLIEAACVITGTPFTGPKRIKEAIEKEDPFALFGQPTKKKSNLHF